MPSRGHHRFHRALSAPNAVGTQDGLAFATFAPQGAPRGRLVILHGADSSKESHFDFARAAAAAGFSVGTFDQRGHGESGGLMGLSICADIAAIAGRLGTGPLVLRGSSMGGYLALVCAHELEAAAVVAICPASAALLQSGLEGGRFSFAADPHALAQFLLTHDAKDAVGALTVPILLLHASGDEQVPVSTSQELFSLARSPRSRFVEVPGGHHRSIQHDAELQGVALRFLTSALSDGDRNRP